MGDERYVIADDESSLWGHLFGPGRDETITRFVFDRQQMSLAAAEFRIGSAWTVMDTEMVENFHDHLVNANREAIDDPERWDLRTSEEIPDWVEVPAPMLS